MEISSSPVVKVLMDKGVTVLNPSTVYVEDTVDPDRISGTGIVIHPGCRISGKRTLILDGAEIGREGPATVEDCLIGQKVELKGGFFRGSVFLRGSNVGSGAHVREACLLEEETSCAHCVGLKHTVLFPFVTLGSLINFCDCLMAGGTSRKDHSEVGSSYIHFNYTPYQDKATASLIGDVPRGVMLDQPPIFLGGQGGLVGPAVIGYGTVIAAGVIQRESVPEGGRIVTGNQEPSARKPRFIPGLLQELKVKVRSNIAYIANLIALKAWYAHVRILFSGYHPLEEELLRGAAMNLDLAVDERISRLKGLADKIPQSLDLHRNAVKTRLPSPAVEQQEELLENWNFIADALAGCRSYAGSDRIREAFLASLQKDIPDRSDGYTEAIRGLARQTKESGTAWLSGIVQAVMERSLERTPLFQ
jgi:UDP-N-acetylglucosamine/UDP-N-acetylgalactosamine diphosphorylase